MSLFHHVVPNVSLCFNLYGISVVEINVFVIHFILQIKKGIFICLNLTIWCFVRLHYIMFLSVLFSIGFVLSTCCTSVLSLCSLDSLYDVTKQLLIGFILAISKTWPTLENGLGRLVMSLCPMCFA